MIQIYFLTSLFYLQNLGSISDDGTDGYSHISKITFLQTHFAELEIHKLDKQNLSPHNPHIVMYLTPFLCVFLYSSLLKVHTYVQQIKSQSMVSRCHLCDKIKKNFASVELKLKNFRFQPSFFISSARNWLGYQQRCKFRYYSNRPEPSSGAPQLLCTFMPEINQISVRAGL